MSGSASSTIEVRSGHAAALRQKMALLDVIIGGALYFSRNQQIDDVTLVVAKSLGVHTAQKTGSAGQFKAKA